MYRLAIYYLASLLLLAAVLSAFGVLPYNPLFIVLSSIYLLAVSYFSNLVFAKIAKVKPNTESAFITALILALIVGPLLLWGNLIFLTAAALIAMASKYILVWRGRHIFNPAALAVVITALVLNQGASWWVGTNYLTPAVALFGLVLTRKIGREALVFSFLAIYLILVIIFNPGIITSLGGILNFIWQLLLFSPILFFAFVMLPEPQTSPKRKTTRLAYAIFTAAVLALLQTYLQVSYTMELALLAGNFFTFIIARDARVNLILKDKNQIGHQIFGFWFQPGRKINFIPGQFLEWTVYHRRADSRGIRRYFTIASSPTEPDVLLAVKYPDKASTFKNTLVKLNAGERIAATGPEGDFILPQDLKQKLVFIAGGIGITPFRSMVKYLLDKNLRCDIVLFYSANAPEEFVFEDIFKQAQDKFGLKIIRTLTDNNRIPQNWQDHTGFIDDKMIKAHVPDWQQRLFYVSGPEPMVRAMVKILKIMGAGDHSIKRDYFPGYEEI